MKNHLQEGLVILLKQGPLEALLMDRWGSSRLPEIDFFLHAPDMVSANICRR